MKFFVYALKDGRRTFYIGKARHYAPHKRSRIDQHFYDARRGSRLPVHYKIRKMQRTGCYVRVKILFETDDHDQACEEEKRLIALYRRKYGSKSLLNLTEGGDGGLLGYKHGEKARKKISRRQKQVWGDMPAEVKHRWMSMLTSAAAKANRGKKHNPERVAKIKNLWASLNPQQKRKLMGAGYGAFKGRKHTLATKRKLARIISPISSRKWQDPLFREKTTAATRDAVRRWWANPKNRKIQSRQNLQRMERRWSNPRERRRLEKILAAARAKLRSDPRFRERNREIAIAAWRDPKFRAGIRAFQKKRWKNPEVRKQSSLIAKRLMADPKRRARISASVKKYWSDPVKRALLAAAIRRGHARRKRINRIHVKG